MRTPLFSRLASTAVALGLTSLALAGAGTAPAQAAVGDCPSGYFCAWQNAEATGSMFKTNTNKATLGLWDGKIVTGLNRTSMVTCLYSNPDYGREEGYAAVEPGGSAKQFGGNSSFSSVKFVPSTRECVGNPYPDWHSETSPKAAGFGDLNADRKTDVLIRDTAGRLWFLPGDGTGRLVGTGGWNAFNALTRHGDFSRDGKEDVIGREKSTGKLWLYPGTGTGGLGARKLIGSGGWNGMSQITAFGDLSGDGWADLIAVEKSTGKLWLYPGTGTGGLGARKLIGSGGWNGMNALVGVGDMNRDGKPDLYAREASTGKLWLYRGQIGSIASRVLVGDKDWSSMEPILGLGDWSGDGLPDLLASNGDWLVHYKGNGAGGINVFNEASYDWTKLNGSF